MKTRESRAAAESAPRAPSIQPQLIGAESPNHSEITQSRKANWPAANEAEICSPETKSVCQWTPRPSQQPQCVCVFRAIACGNLRPHRTRRHQTAFVGCKENNVPPHTLRLALFGCVLGQELWTVRIGVTFFCFFKNKSGFLLLCPRLSTQLWNFG